MNKKLVSLLSSSLLIISLTGCNASVKIFGKEVFSSQELPQQEYVEKKEEQELPTPSLQYNEDEIISMVSLGKYTLTVDNTSYEYGVQEVLRALFEEEPQYVVEHYMGDEYFVQASNTKGDRFVTFQVNKVTCAMSIVEVFNEGILYEGNDANTILPYIVYEELFNTSDGTLTKKQQVAKEEVKDNTSKEEVKKEEPKQEKKEEKKQETPKTCKWCYTNQLPSGSGENDKCKECQEECWNFDCNDCGKNMSLSEYWSSGHDTGFCPSCYDSYLAWDYQQENTDTNHKCYYCDRCGKDITYKNFVQNFSEGGYYFDYICEGCLLELGY